MPVNIGTLDQYVRIVLGLALIAYAFQEGLAIQGWHWAGLLGMVPLVTALLQKLPALCRPGHFKLPRPPVDQRFCGSRRNQRRT